MLYLLPFPAIAFSSLGNCEESKKKIDANGIQLDGNDPTEDRLIVKYLESIPGAFYMAVFDGHGASKSNWQVSHFCNQKMHVHLEQHLKAA